MNYEPLTMNYFTKLQKSEVESSFNDNEIPKLADHDTIPSMYKISACLVLRI